MPTQTSWRTDIRPISNPPCNQRDSVELYPRSRNSQMSSPRFVPPIGSPSYRRVAHALMPRDGGQLAPLPFTPPAAPANTASRHGAFRGFTSHSLIMGVWRLTSHGGFTCRDSGVLGRLSRRYRADMAVR